MSKINTSGDGFEALNNMNKKKEEFQTKEDGFDISSISFSNETEYPCMVSGEKALVVGVEERGFGDCVKGCNLCRVNTGRVTIEKGVVVKCDDGNVHDGIMTLRQSIY